MSKVYSKYACYCGFENVVSFKMPSLKTKAWLESECLSCQARYDIRIYPHENKGQVNVHKRLLVTSPEVERAIAKSAKEDKYNEATDEKRIKESKSN
jgi:hypothetical protein